MNNNQSDLRQIVDDMLDKRIETGEDLSGFSIRGAVAGEMICGDCGDGDCECSS
ncbi:hypothetical protein KKH39_02935 [Patescibacteria group bacterium]|nr:hypothetical protein [Patescibacteria group bacterium]